MSSFTACVVKNIAQQNTASLCKKVIITCNGIKINTKFLPEIGENWQNFCPKLAKIAEIRDHNIDS
jgi:hypothetical protein